MYTEQECGDSKPESHSSTTGRDIFDLIIEDSTKDVMTNEAKYIHNLEREGGREGGREEREVTKLIYPPILI